MALLDKLRRISSAKREGVTPGSYKKLNTRIAITGICLIVSLGSTRRRPPVAHARARG